MKITLPWAKPKDNYLVLLVFVLVCQAAGAIGTIFTIPSIPTWYAALNKPVFSPPNWLFGPVWTLLYTLMAISAYLIWRKYKFGKKARTYWWHFLSQLALNALWSPIFFGAQQIGIALLVILCMWYCIYRTITSGKRLVPWSSYLLYPYLAWVSFATILNFSLLVLN